MDLARFNITATGLIILATGKGPMNRGVNFRVPDFTGNVDNHSLCPSGIDGLVEGRRFEEILLNSGPYPTTYVDKTPG